MSNTYFELKKKVITKGFDTFPGYTNDYRLSLTAFMSNKERVQLTITTNSTLSSQSGTGYIVLSDEEIDLLIAGLLERKLNKISATNEEKSNYCPPLD